MSLWLTPASPESLGALCASSRLLSKTGTTVPTSGAGGFSSSSRGPSWSRPMQLAKARSSTPPKLERSRMKGNDMRRTLPSPLFERCGFSGGSGLRAFMGRFGKGTSGSGDSSSGSSMSAAPSSASLMAISHSLCSTVSSSPPLSLAPPAENGTDTDVAFLGDSEGTTMPAVLRNSMAASRLMDTSRSVPPAFSVIGAVPCISDQYFMILRFSSMSMVLRSCRNFWYTSSEILICM
mmetsp:Transcript_29337/g.94084  ORF Transcript_29337/g.94084 Transcript_29337/m.94084 type:complete len:236 (-) Transcript_29337:478-1185(-)